VHIAANREISPKRDEEIKNKSDKYQESKNPPPTGQPYFHKKGTQQINRWSSGANKYMNNTE